MTTSHAHEAGGGEMILWVAGLLAALALPFALANPYPIHVATLILLYVILAIGLSIVVGYAGLLDVGYVAFFAVGAYFFAILNTRHGVGIGVALPSAAILAALAGVLLGFPTLRVRGDYLALVTLAFGEIVRQVLQNWTSLTNGPKGIPGVSRPIILELNLSPPSRYYYLVLACTALAVFIVMKIARSPVARLWEAIRDEEVAARASGIDATRWLLLAFAIGAAFAGLVGVLFASIQSFVSPESFVLEESILVLSIVVLAGGKSLPRIFLGAFVLCGIPELLRSFQQYRPLLFGMLLVGFTVLDHRFRGRRAAQAPPGTQTVELAEGDRGSFPQVLRPSRPAATAIVISHVHKSFAGLKALDDVSFDLPCSGRIVGLVGPNGAGKTTLFNCLTGLETIDSGRIAAEGIGELSNLPGHQVARLGVGRTFQTLRLFRSMTVRQNVEVGAFCSQPIPVTASLIPGLSHRDFDAQVSARVDAALAYVGLSPLADRLVSDLPSGLQRKVEIARALALRPRLLLLDEIASGLNDAEKRDLAGLLSALRSSGGIPILLVEHDIAFVTGLADHLVVMDAGRVLIEGIPAEVVRDERVIVSYLGCTDGTHAELG
jgi:branched-chain amino acid transport system permease protein